MSSVNTLRTRISDSSLDQVVLEEMIRHGFWDRGAEIGEMPAEFFERRAALQAEIADILARDRRLADPDKALQAVMKERMRQARLKRVETKRKAIETRNARAAAFDARKRAEVISLGDVSSAPLLWKEADTERLAKQGLPVIEGAIALSEAMGIGLPELKFLAHDRKVARVTHYQTFEIPKKAGGVRVISAPKPRMKRAQYWVMENILSCVAPHDAAHGFRAGRSILTNATPHVGQELVVNMDLRDFFPTITYGRVKGLFAAMGYAESDAALLALISTEAPRETIDVDGTTWHVATGPRATPQGAPTSPAIANLVARKLDRRLSGLARRFGFSYTRYADDLTFSGDFPGDQGLKAFHAAVRAITADEGFALHPDKTRFMRRGGRQEVTGLTVNDKVSVPRSERRKFRAWLHQVEKNGGPMHAFRAGNPVTSGQGYASFLYMVGGTESLALAERAWMLLGRQTGVRADEVERASAFRAASGEGRLPHPDWWQPADPQPLEPIPLPAFDRKDQDRKDVQSAIPKAGTRTRRAPAALERPGQEARTRAALARSNRVWGGRQTPSTSEETRPQFRWFKSLVAYFLQLVPAIGFPLAVIALYFIWRPRKGQPGSSIVGKVFLVVKIVVYLFAIDYLVWSALIVLRY